jgi:hypothetical protein
MSVPTVDGGGTHRVGRLAGGAGVGTQAPGSMFGDQESFSGLDASLPVAGHDAGLHWFGWRTPTG